MPAQNQASADQGVQPEACIQARYGRKAPTRQRHHATQPGQSRSPTDCLPRFFEAASHLRGHHVHPWACIWLPVILYHLTGAEGQWIGQPFCAGTVKRAIRCLCVDAPASSGSLCGPYDTQRLSCAFLAEGRPRVLHRRMLRQT
jgi:hypothetical protein